MKKNSKQHGMSIKSYVPGTKRRPKGNGVIVIDTTVV